MRKELQEILTKTVEQMTDKDAKMYSTTLNNIKRNTSNALICGGITGIVAIVGAVVLGAVMKEVVLSLVFGGIIISVGALSSCLYLLTEMANNEQRGLLKLSKKEKREFKKAHGFEKMEQLLSEYTKLHGDAFLNENQTTGYDEIKKEVNIAQPTTDLPKNKKDKLKKEASETENETNIENGL